MDCAMLDLSSFGLFTHFGWPVLALVSTKISEILRHEFDGMSLAIKGNSTGNPGTSHPVLGEHGHFID